MSENAVVHTRYNIPREIHKRLLVEAAMQEVAVQDLVSEILDENLPSLPAR